MTLDVLKSLLTKEQLAINAGVSVATINRWIAAKKITSIKIGNRCLFSKDIEIPEKGPKKLEVHHE